MLRSPSSGSELWKALDREIGEPWQDRRQIVPHGKLHSAAAFYYGEDGCDLRSGLWAAHVNPVLRPTATGRIEFSARLLLSSSSGYSRKRVNLGQSVSVYWQALASALEGKALDRTVSMSILISPNNGVARFWRNAWRPAKFISCVRASASMANRSANAVSIA